MTTPAELPPMPHPLEARFQDNVPGAVGADLPKQSVDTLPRRGATVLSETPGNGEVSMADFAAAGRRGENNGASAQNPDSLSFISTLRSFSPDEAQAFYLHPERRPALLALRNRVFIDDPGAAAWQAYDLRSKTAEAQSAPHFPFNGFLLPSAVVSTANAERPVVPPHRQPEDAQVVESLYLPWSPPAAKSRQTQPQAQTARKGRVYRGRPVTAEPTVYVGGFRTRDGAGTSFAQHDHSTVVMDQSHVSGKHRRPGLLARHRARRSHKV